MKVEQLAQVVVHAVTYMKVSGTGTGHAAEEAVKKLDVDRRMAEPVRLMLDGGEAWALAWALKNVPVDDHYRGHELYVEGVRDE